MMRLIASTLLLFTACADDQSSADADTGPIDCDPTLEEWCAEGLCGGFETLDDALESVAGSSEAWSVASRCGDRVVASQGEGYAGASYVFDVESGELIGGLLYGAPTDGGMCDIDRATAGDTQACQGERCLLIGFPFETTGELTPCDGALGEKLEAKCLADVPKLVAGCEACACGACYPPLLRCGEYDGSLCAQLAVRCLVDHCATECASQIEAVDE